PDGSTRAIRGADALLFYLSSPCNIESLEFVSSLKGATALFLCLRFTDESFAFVIFIGRLKD
ncbi:hypothetical protein, partial [Yersinia enterocolitica]|uniref:hypothetical protein n=1 Tax=Yersinia enterocolitica TaxID=630 RepID=UPI000A5917ED